MFGSPNSAGSTAGRDGMPAPDDRAWLSTMFVTADMEDDALALAQARRMLHFIEIARGTFPGLRELADHPGWEIMLQIFVAEAEGRTLATAGLCDLTGCWRPLTLRYVELLIERGIVERAGAPAQSQDAQILRLVPDAATRFKDLLCGYARGWAPPGAD